jgi:outer membrane protein
MDIQTPITLSETTFDIDNTTYLERYSNIDQRTEIQLLEKQGDLLALNKKSINAQRYPSLSFTANYGYLGLGSQFPYFASSAQGVTWSDFSSIGLNLRIPLFAGFSNRAKVQQAQIEIDKFEADFRDTKLALSLAAENAYTQITNALITLDNQKANVRLAKDVLSDVENNYQNGLATLTDLLDAETSYLDAQNSYTNALIDYKVAEVQVIKAKGTLKNFYSLPNN